MGRVKTLLPDQLDPVDDLLHVEPYLPECACVVIGECAVCAPVDDDDLDVDF